MSHQNKRIEIHIIDTQNRLIKNMVKRNSSKNINDPSETAMAESPTNIKNRMILEGCTSDIKHPRSSTRKKSLKLSYNIKTRPSHKRDANSTLERKLKCKDMIANSAQKQTRANLFVKNSSRTQEKELGQIKILGRVSRLNKKLEKSTQIKSSEPSMINSKSYQDCLGRVSQEYLKASKYKDCFMSSKTATPERGAMFSNKVLANVKTEVKDPCESPPKSINEFIPYQQLYEIKDTGDYFKKNSKFFNFDMKHFKKPGKVYYGITSKVRRHLSKVEDSPITKIEEGANRKVLYNLPKLQD